MNIAITIIISIFLFIIIVYRNKSKMRKNITKAVYIIVNTEKESENHDLIRELIRDFENEIDIYTKITSYDTTLEIIQEEERNIQLYGSIIKLINWTDNEDFKVRHGMIWSVLTKYCEEKNVNIDKRTCYIDAVKKRDISSIIIRIF